MKVLHIVPSLNVETGGPAQSVVSLADAQVDSGIDVTILTLDYRRHGRLMLPKRATVETIGAPWLTRALRGWSPEFFRAADRLAVAHDVVHGHGLWMQPNRAARVAALHAHKPLVISPRGMLEHYSLHRSAWRKRAAMMMFERRNLQSAALFHATSDSEAVSIRNCVPDADVVVIPNVVDHLEVPVVPNAEPHVLLYLGRLDQKKGLDWLLSAWAALAPEFPKWALRIVGPIGLGFETALRDLKQAHERTPRVTWLPPLDGFAKHRELAASTAVVLPSRSENFGNVVVEAMQHAKPVLATAATPWGILRDEHLGFHVPTSVDGIRDGLRQLMSLSPDDLNAMGQRGRIHATAAYSSDSIGSKWARHYEQLLVAARPRSNA